MTPMSYSDAELNDGMKNSGKRRSKDDCLRVNTINESYRIENRAGHLEVQAFYLFPFQVPFPPVFYLND